MAVSLFQHRWQNYLAVVTAFLFILVGCTESISLSQFEGSESIDELKSTYLQAVRSAEQENIAQLFHESTQSCFRDQFQDYWQDELAVHVSRKGARLIDSRNHAAMESPLYALYQEKSLKFSKIPDWLVELDLEQKFLNQCTAQAEQVQGTVQLWVSQVNSRWWLVAPCVDQMSYQAWLEQKKRNQEQNQRVRLLSAYLNDALKSELIRVYTEKGKLKAAQVYAAKTEGDLSEGVAVIGHLCKER